MQSLQYHPCTGPKMLTYIIDLDQDPKGNHPLKCQLIRISRFGGVNKQKNKHTLKLTDILLL